MGISSIGIVQPSSIPPDIGTAAANLTGSRESISQIANAPPDSPVTYWRLVSMGNSRMRESSMSSAATLEVVRRPGVVLHQ
jgi:hypothetical protein